MWVVVIQAKRIDYYVVRKLTEKRREFNLETTKFSSLNRNFVAESNELFAISFN
jgi:hypothetical protein